MGRAPKERERERERERIRTIENMIMGDFEPAFVHALSVQSWSLYSVGIFLVFFRM